MKIQFNNYNYSQSIQTRKSQQTGNINFRNQAQRVAVYAGTFDPITNGHFDLVKAGSKLFDKLIVLIGKNSKKTPLIPLEKRTELIKSCVKDLDNVEVDSYEGLTVDYAKQHNANYLLRGMRSVMDFNDEMQIASLNEDFEPDIRTVFLFASSINKATSSSVVRELLANKSFERIKMFVPEPVYNYFVETFKTGK